MGNVKNANLLALVVLELWTHALFVMVATNRNLLLMELAMPNVQVDLLQYKKMILVLNVKTTVNSVIQRIQALASFAINLF
jgi:hypothetical protein